MDISRILVFDLKGYMAHFRKFYTNSSALTYTFPPYTTITGLIAGILGRQRDSYYQEFNHENCQIAISINSGTRKVVQTMNYIRTKNKREFNGSAGPTPTPLEILLSSGINLGFRIYFSHRNQQLMETVKERIQENRYVYPPYLGITEFTASLDFIADLKESEIKQISQEDIAEIDTVINTDFIKDKGIRLEKTTAELKIFKEKMPLEFGESRRLKKVASFIFDANGQNIPVILTVPYYQIQITGGKENILFLNQEGGF